jgi:hypothetical protein
MASPTGIEVVNIEDDSLDSSQDSGRDEAESHESTGSESTGGSERQRSKYLKHFDFLHLELKYKCKYCRCVI